MIELSRLVAQGQGLDAVLVQAAATVELDWDVRRKSRFDAVDSRGRGLRVFLPRGSVVRGGDVLLAGNGEVVRVIAAAQPVLRIHCRDGDDRFGLMRAAYHLGNRHVPVELTPELLRIEADHVLADMLRAMGLQADAACEAFEPEAGAYAEHAHGAGHAHGHDHCDAPPMPAGLQRQHDPKGHDHGGHVRD